ncbi:MAG: hypothetical protein DRN90_06655 [Thermoproteota archaeon]|nr:MAG: hypothetical protein DRN90_06655 [Candidatus Korarchaeota archaeon]RLG47547.1 MAG: hypothetical protein DRN92_02945 [Candidatus Korarchaeota archaeon]
MSEEKFEVEVEAPLYPTESKEAVIRAILNIVPAETEEIKTTEGNPPFLKLKKRGHEALTKIRRLLREERILDTARDMLISSLKRSGVMTLLLHKQAAYVGELRLCSSEDESPLGVIRVKFSFKGDTSLFLDWLAPKTVSGRVPKEVEIHELIGPETS